MIEILSKAVAMSGRLVEWRRELHRRPELSFREHSTARFVMGVLRDEGIDFRPVAGTGVLARIGEGRDAVVLRADIDALPLTECTGLSYSSGNEGVMHACGHDMHTAALLGALVLLKKKKVGGTVFGLFQPGEEQAPGGATLVLTEDPFRGYDIRAFYGQHVDPELPVGTFGVRAGEYMASTDELHVEVCGQGGHGALRAAVKDPVQAAAMLLIKLLELGNTPDSVLSIGRIVADGATNVIPDKVSLQGTMRTFDEGLRTSLKQAVRDAAAQVDVRLGVCTRIDERPGYPSVINDPALASVAASMLGEVGTVMPLERRMTGEDFGFYTRRYPSLFYRFGVGTAAGKLHTPAFNPSEEALPYAVAGMAMLAAGMGSALE